MLSFLLDTLYVAKTKAQISCAVTAQLICAFVFTFAKGRFSHDAAHICFAGSGTYSDSVEDLKTYFTDGLCCKETEVTQHEMVSLCREWELHNWMLDGCQLFWGLSN